MCLQSATANRWNARLPQQVYDIRCSVPEKRAQIVLAAPSDSL